MAIPFTTGVFSDEDSDAPSSSTTNGTVNPETDTSNDAAADRDDEVVGPPAPSDGDDASPVVSKLLGAADPTSPTADSIRDRLSPLTATSQDEVEPFSIPQATTLYQAVLLHPAHTQQDLHYVEAIEPLPRDLDRALAHIVAAHAVSTQMLSQPTPPPGATLQASVTMATAMDSAMPTLEKYVDHPIWDEPKSSSSNDLPSSYTLETPSLDEALLNLYGALGLPDEKINQLAPQVETATQELSEPEAEALAKLVTAQAQVQQSAARSLLFISAPQSHRTGAVDDAADASLDEVDSTLEGTPLSDLQEATAQLRAAADAARETFDNSRASEETHRTEPWVDPLGLIVVGSPNNDTFDGNLGGMTDTREAVGDSLDGLRNTVGEVSVNTTRTGPTAGENNGTGVTASVDAANKSSVPEPGWHMLVLDPGGDDTYRNNAGGIAAGRVVVDARADFADSTAPARTLVFQGDAICPPGPICVSPLGSGNIKGLLESSSGLVVEQGPIPVGIPLTAAVVDVDGDDDYQHTGRVIQGAAEGLAVGMLVDASGDDRYNASRVAQGAAQQYGYGELVDLDGDDHYNATARAQGYVNLPDPEASVKNAPLQFFGGASDVPLKTARFSQATLTDRGGVDEYVLDDLLEGQGIVEMGSDLARVITATFLSNPERAPASLVDVGGEHNLPVPTVELTDNEITMRPSTVNNSQAYAEFWLARPVPTDATTQSFLQFPSQKYKTAFHANRSTIQDPTTKSTYEVGLPNVTMRPCSGEQFCRRSFSLEEGFEQANTEGSPLMLFGEPANVHDTPPVTVTFGGETNYTGQIASVPAPGDRGAGLDDQAMEVAGADTPPEILLDLDGDDTYEGGDNTIGFTDAESGVAMLVDRMGDDVMEAGNRTIGFAGVDAGNRSTGNPVAAVLDLDGNLTASSEAFSQAYARNGQALVDLGANRNVGEGGATLVAGNRSQGYSVGTGVGVLVGSNGDDTYHVDGWGQGFHTAERYLSVNSCGSAVPLFKIGGIGLLVDPDGNDDYSIDSQIGQADTIDEGANPCGSDEPGNRLNILRLGVLLDVRGQDDYQMAENPPRPDRYPDRACSGANRTECEPNDDRSWAVVNENKTAETTTGTSQIKGNSDSIESFGPLGIGVDNVRNAHHLAAALCRGYDPVNPYEGNGGHVSQLHDPVTRQADSVDRGAGPVAGALLFAQCDEFVRATWDAYLGPAIDDNLPLDRTPQLKLSLPRGDAPVTQPARSFDPDDELPGGQELPGQPLDTVLPEEPVFLESAGQPSCQDRQATRNVNPTQGPDLACLSVTREISLGEWITPNPRDNPRDPGNTIGCNCSAQLEIQAAQNESIRLFAIQDRGLYPTNGRVTMMTEDRGSWYNAHARFRLPVSVQGLIQDGKLNADPRDRVSSAADFPIDLSTLPSGFAKTKVTTVVEGVPSEESGGLVPSTSRTWQRTIVHERAFERSIVADTPDENVVFFAADGPVDPTKLPELKVNATDDVADELEDLDWTRTSSGNFTHALPDERVIDAPRLLADRDPISTLAATHGDRGCAALLMEREADNKGVCWTGDAFVVALPVGDVQTSDIHDVGVDGTPIDTTLLNVTDHEPEPRIRFAASDGDEPVDYEVQGLGDEVRGVPGRIVLDEGIKLAEEITGKEVDGAWAKLTVSPHEPNTIGIEPETPELAQLCADFDPCTFGDAGPQDDDPHPNHNHTDQHAIFGAGDRSHPHVAVIGDESDKPIATEEKLRLGDGTSVRVLACLNLEYSSIQDARELLTLTGTLDDTGCITFAQGDELVYLVPLGEQIETRLVRVGAQLLEKSGNRVNETITAHIDRDGPQGQIAVQPTASGDPVRTVQLRGFPQTLQTARLTTGQTDLVDIGLQAQINDTWVNWTDPAEETGPFADLPTDRFPVVKAELNLSRIFNETDAERIQLRGVLSDESNNTVFTPSKQVILDKTAPDVQSARVLTSDGQARLVLEVDESLSGEKGISCAQRGCPLDVPQPIPGAEPKAFLDLSNVKRGTQTLQIPVVGLQRGPIYNVSLEFTDTLGNTATREISVDTTAPLEVNLESMNGTLVNRTITLDWTADTVGKTTLSTRTSAYLLLPNSTCAIVQNIPGVVSGTEPQKREAGPVSVLGETGEQPCEIPGEGVDAKLLLYALAPSVDALALDQVPVTVDTNPPRVNLTARSAWSNGTVTVSATANDTLPSELSIFVDETPRDVEGEEAEIAVTEEGIHSVIAEATDLAGNVGVNETEVKIDRTSPSLSANVVGVRGGLALVNVTADDALSGVHEVRLVTPSTRGPPVTGVGNQSVLLSAPVSEGDDQIVVTAKDQAHNARDVRLTLDSVPRVDSGALVHGLELTTPAPDTLSISFATTEFTTPVVIVDAGDRHVERGLDSDRSHELTIDKLPPGRQAKVTVTVPRNASLVPAANATTSLPDDNQPPSKLPDVTAKATDQGIRLAWNQSTDNVGVDKVLVERNGREVARTGTSSYIDDPGTHQEHTYRLAPIDLAGNRGPWTQVEVTPKAQFEITNLTTEPANPTPSDPITIRTTVETPAGLVPDIVTLTVAGNELPMRPVEVGTFTSTYEVTTQMPAFNVTSGDAELVVEAVAEDRTERETFPAPVVAQTQPGGPSASPDGIPSAGLIGSIAVLAAVAISRRRWIE